MTVGKKPSKDPSSWQSPEDVFVDEVKVREKFERGPFDGELDLIVHHRNPKTGRVIRTNPYQKLVGKGAVSVYEQPVGSGKFFYESRKRVDQWRHLPEDFRKQLMWKEQVALWDAYQADVKKRAEADKVKAEEEALKSKIRKDLMQEMTKRPLKSQSVTSKPVQSTEL